jgi:hypothetical protein
MPAMCVNAFGPSAPPVGMRLDSAARVLLFSVGLSALELARLAIALRRPGVAARTPSA